MLRKIYMADAHCSKQHSRGGLQCHRVKTLAVFWHKVKQQPQHDEFVYCCFDCKAPLSPNTCLWKYFWIRLWRWSILLQHKHWTSTCLLGCAMKWKMSIKNFSIRQWAGCPEERCGFISLSSLSNRHISCSDFRLDCACCFADELWLSRMAYLGELFTCLVCWVPVYKQRPKTRFHVMTKQTQRKRLKSCSCNRRGWKEKLSITF